MLNESLLLGEQTIDGQHDELFRLFDRLRLNADRKFSDEIALDILSELNHQIIHHFETEETLMAGMALPEPLLAAHLAAHLAILEDLAQFHMEIMVGKIVSPADLIAQVAMWVVHHLLEFDIGLRPFISCTKTH